MIEKVLEWVAVARSVNGDRLALRHVHVVDGIASAADGYRCRRAPVDLPDGYVDLEGRTVECAARFPDTTRLLPDERWRLTVRAAPLRRTCERLIGSADFTSVGERGQIPVILLRAQAGEVNVVAMPMENPTELSTKPPAWGSVTPGKAGGRMAWAVDARMLSDALAGHKLAIIAGNSDLHVAMIRADGASLVPEGAVEIIMGIAIPEEWAG